MSEQTYMRKQSEVASTAQIYRQVNIINSKIGEKSIIADNTDILSSHIGDHCRVDRRNLILDSIIKDASYTGCNTVLKHVIVEKYSCISWNVSLGGDAHNYEALSLFDDYNWQRVFELGDFDSGFEGSPGCHIGNDVWIASSANVISGVEVGDGAVIGAGAVVIRDIPPYAIAVGVPAKVIKYRFSRNVIERLLKIKWWNWDYLTLKENSRLLHSEMTESTLRELESIALKLER